MNIGRRMDIFDTLLKLIMEQQALCKSERKKIRSSGRSILNVAAVRHAAVMPHVGGCGAAAVMLPAATQMHKRTRTLVE